MEPLALVQEAKGRHRDALSLAQRAAQALPLPQTVATVGDLYARHGRPRAARQQYALVDVIQRLLAANGVRTDLEIAQFDADHGVRIGRALAAARQARRARPSIDGDDVLAWALERNGRCAEALPYLAAGASPRHARRAQVLPPRNDRALPRARIPLVVRQGRAPEPALLHPLEPARPEVRIVKRLALLVGLVAALAAPAAANAHPLGNFTVNRFSGIELSGDRVYVEVRPGHGGDPGLPGAAEDHGRASATSGTSRAGSAEGSTCSSTAGRSRSHRSTTRSPSRPEPPACARFASRLCTPPSEAQGDSNSVIRTSTAGSAGRRSCSTSRDRASAGSSSVPSTSVSHELAAYPKDLLSSPLEVTSATAIVQPGDGPGKAPQLESGAELSARAAVRATGDGGFASLIARDDLGVGVILISLALAFFWGSAHALSPGHGKAIVTAYLVGQRGKPRHAAALGLIVTATHTIGVFTLGFVTLALSQFIVPEQLYPWIGLVSGLLVVGVGASVLLGDSGTAARTATGTTTITTTMATESSAGAR